MYECPDRMFCNCAASVVPLPSGASHLPLKVPPTPTENGVKTKSLGLLSLKGAPKNPQTTPALVVGVTVAEACMCAAVKLSLTSGVCEPVTSILKIVALNVMAVMASFRVNVAVPNDAGLEPPVLVVGFVGGFSWEFVRFANRTVSAYALVLANKAIKETKRIMRSCLMA